MPGLADLTAFLAANGPVVRAELTRVAGSSPRNEGTVMLIAEAALCGTIGGGRLEFLVVEEARGMLRDGLLQTTLDLPLGPEIGQCCGGRVTARLTRMRAADKAAALRDARATQAALPEIYVCGAGHVGRALADLLQHMPVRCVLMDSRAEELAQSDAAVEKRLSVLPEMDIAGAAPRSAFVVLTHDHGLDFLLTSAALERQDAAYVGMIGSKTKRVKFRNWMRDTAGAGQIEQLTCPIGATQSADKRPAVIAAFVVAEILETLTCGAATASAPDHRATPVPQPERDPLKGANRFAEARISHGGGHRHDHDHV